MPSYLPFNVYIAERDIVDGPVASFPVLQSDGTIHQANSYVSETVVNPLTDQTQSSLQQLQDAVDLGGTIRLMPGTYRIPRGPPVLFTVTTKIIWEKGAEIYFDDNVDGQGNPCFSCLGNLDIDIEFVNPNFRGKWGVTNYNLGSHFMELHLSGSFRCTGGYFTLSRYMTMVIIGAKLAYVEGNWLNLGKRDGIRLIDCTRNVVIGNTCDKIMDDSIAIHTTDAGNSPKDRTVVVTGNTIRDGQGIVLVGAKDFSITGNVLKRIQTRAISVGAGGIGDTDEGNTATMAGTITGNVIDTVFDGFLICGSGGSQNDYIHVDTHVPTPNAFGYAEGPNGSGGVVSPYPYFFTNNTDVVPPNIGPRNIIVANNICMRSYEPTTLYSDYGLGSRMTVSGPFNVAITAAILGLDNPLGPRAHLIFTGHLANAVISGNHSYGGYDGIQFEGDYLSTYLCWKNVLVEGNQVINYVRRGLSIVGRGTVEIKSNMFDGDPLHTNPARNANGKWDSGNDICGVYSDALTISVGSGNSFKNLQSIDGGTGVLVESWSDTTIYADPVQIGYNANNTGIGNLNYPAAYGATNFIVEDGDPSSSTFGRVKNICVNNSVSIPTTGKYAIGWFVRNRLFTIVGNMSLRGWVRLTTGTGHVLNTDWAECWESTAPNRLTITDGITAPSALAGSAQIYVDTADGDLKVIFADSVVKTIVVDT